MSQIDFVITWVDDNDPKWIQEFNKYFPDNINVDTNKKRYRSWENLQYWFRGVEKFSPWVNKIHFVTYGHVPKWLNIEHPKLNVVKHEQYMQKEHLPVFNSHPIEVNLHRIKDLADQFVYFNDDTFIVNEVSSTRFFKNGLPCDIAVNNVVDFSGIEHILVNNLAIINKYFIKKQVIKSNVLKWFSLRYKLHLVKTLFLLPWKQITGFFDPHQAQPYLKSTYYDVWDLEKDVLNQTSKSKFRSSNDVNQYLFRYWQLMRANFEPISISDSKLLVLHTINDCKMFSTIAHRYKLVCLNDELDDEEFDTAKDIINKTFVDIFPEKSSFEI